MQLIPFFADVLNHVLLFLIAWKEFAHGRVWVSHQAKSSRRPTSFVGACRPNVPHVAGKSALPPIWALWSPSMMKMFMVGI